VFIKRTVYYWNFHYLPLILKIEQNWFHFKTFPSISRQGWHTVLTKKAQNNTLFCPFIVTNILTMTKVRLKGITKVRSGDINDCRRWLSSDIRVYVTVFK
jgi:hypothetical protein